MNGVKYINEALYGIHSILLFFNLTCNSIVICGHIIHIQTTKGEWKQNEIEISIHSLIDIEMYSSASV